MSGFDLGVDVSIQMSFLHFLGRCVVHISISGAIVAIIVPSGGCCIIIMATSSMFEVSGSRLKIIKLFSAVKAPFQHFSNLL